jgi:hypothetical protein
MLPANTVPGSAPVRDKLSQLNKRRMDGLTKFERRAIEEGEENPIYIYNVSTIDEWARFQGQLGTLTIPKCEPGKQVSKPLIIPGCIPRRYDAGFGRYKWFLDTGMDVAQDICGCSKEYPAETANNNLTNFGVFITTKLWEELSEKQQKQLLYGTPDEPGAVSKYEEKLRQRVLEADNFHIQNHSNWVVKIHHQALAALNDILEQRGMEREKRPWATVDYGTKKKTVDCPYCGSPNKPDVPKCANCHEIIDQALYKKLKGEK